MPIEFPWKGSLCLNCLSECYIFNHGLRTHPMQWRLFPHRASVVHVLNHEFFRATLYHVVLTLIILSYSIVKNNMHFLGRGRSLKKDTVMKKLFSIDLIFIHKINVKSFIGSFYRSKYVKKLEVKKICYQDLYTKALLLVIPSEGYFLTEHP